MSLAGIAAINHPSSLSFVSQLPTPFLWLDAANPAGNNVIPANGAQVATWKNLAGENFAQGTSNKQGLYTVNAINTQPGIFFDGSNDGYTTNLISTASGPYTFFFVHNPAVTTGTRWLLDTNVIGTRLTIFHAASNQTGFGDGSTHNFGAPITGPQIMCLVLNSGGNVSQMFRNGAQLGSNSTYSARAFSGSSGIGGDATAGFGFYSGYIGFVLGFTRVFTTDQRQFVERNLANRFGISI